MLTSIGFTRGFEAFLSCFSVVLSCFYVFSSCVFLMLFKFIFVEIHYFIGGL